MSSLLERLDEREVAVRERLERLRGEIAALSAEVALAEVALSRLVITRETVLEILPGPGPDPGGAGGGPEDPSVVYRQVVEVVAGAGQALRAKDVCVALGTGTEARHVEGMRSRLKRLVGRGVLAEPDVGLFVVAGGTPLEAAVG